MRRSFALVVVAAFALAAGGCKGKCRQLSEKLCDCAINSVDKSTCLQRISSAEAAAAPTPEDEAGCAGLLAGCDCHTIDTPQGKAACGLARVRGQNYPDRNLP